MKHVIVIETTELEKPNPRYVSRFQAECIAALDKIVRDNEGESFIQTKFYVDSAIEATHEMYNAPKWNRGEAYQKMVEYLHRVVKE